MNEHMGADGAGSGTPCLDDGCKGKRTSLPFQGFLDDVAVVGYTWGSLAWQNRTLRYFNQ
jgi:hypothetical protein